MERERRTVWQRFGKALDDAVRVAHPEAAAGSPAATLRKVLVALCVLAVGALVAFGWEWVTAEARARHEAEIAEKIAAERPSSDADDETVSEERAPGGNALDDNPADDPVSEPSEDRQNDDEEPFDPGIWAYVEAAAPQYPGPGILLMDTLGEEAVETFRSAELDEAESSELLDWLWAAGVPADAPYAHESGVSNRWNVTLNSDGPTAVTVTDLQLADLECVPARAAVAFDLPAQGSDDRMLISFSMEHPSVGRFYKYTDAYERAPGWGEPFFEHKVVNLGGNEEGVGLIVEVVTTDQDCTWSSFELSYQGPEGGGVYEVVSDEGEPFEARGVAPDAETFVVLPANVGFEVRADSLW